MSVPRRRNPALPHDFGKLSPLGVPALEEQLYRDLLTAPQATMAELARWGDVGLPRARQAIRRLERLGLLSRRPGIPTRFVPAPPDVAVGALIARRQDELEQARLSADGMVADFHRGARFEQNSQVLEIIRGPGAIDQRARQLMRGAEREVLVFDKPPYVGSSENPTELEALSRGVQWRAVYSTESLAAPGQLELVRRFRKAGEQARISPLVPTKLAVADRRLALLPLTLEGPVAEETAILVQRSSMLSMLIMHFDSVWERGVPVDRYLAADGDTDTADETPERLILQFLTAGMKDEAIARQLGVSLRTTRRWIARMMADRQVNTRFQLGLTVAAPGQDSTSLKP